MRRPVGVIGANYEARPNVTIDVASQLLKSRNAGVLRTGSAALGSALALHGHVIRPGAGGGRHRPRRHPGRRLARARRGPGAGVPAGPDPAGHPARQRRDHRGAGPGGRRPRRPHPRPRRGRRRALPRPRGRSGDGARPRRPQPRPPGRLQPAQPAARRAGALGRVVGELRGPARGARHPRLAAAARPPARPRVGARRRRRGHGHPRAGRRRRATPRASRTWRPPAWRRPSSPRTPRPRGSSSRPTPAPGRSGTRPPACWTASPCWAPPRPASTSTTCRAPAARSPTAICTCASTWSCPRARPRPREVARPTLRNLWGPEAPPSGSVAIVRRLAGSETLLLASPLHHTEPRGAHRRPLPCDGVSV